MQKTIENAAALTFVLVMAMPATLAAAEADCAPAQFMAPNPESIVESDPTRIAFVRTATAEQYDQAKAVLGDRINIGMLTGPFDYQQARELAKAEALALKFDFDRQYYNGYLAQRINDDAKALYVECMRGEKTGPGLRLWLDRREGDYYFVTGFWIGADPKARGVLNKGETTEDNVGIIKVPEVWQPKAEKTIIAKVGKDKSGAGVISVTVGTSSKSLVFFGEPPRTKMVNLERGGPDMVARSGGATSCERSSDERCLMPVNPEGYFVPNTARFDGTHGPNTGFEITRDTPSQVCVRVWALSPACQTEVRIDGRPVVVERYPGQ